MNMHDIFLFFFLKRKMKQQKMEQKDSIDCRRLFKNPKKFFPEIKSMNEINFSTSAWVSL